MLNHQYWVLVANSSEAKLYGVKFLGSDLNLIQEFSHPEGRNKVGDIMTDKSGHYRTQSGSGGGSFALHSAPLQVELSRFAQTLLNKLDQGLASHDFKKAVVIAPPHFLGELKKDCHPKLKEQVLHFVDKDYTKITQPELIAKLAELEKY